jgi:hypothetical protein
MNFSFLLLRCGPGSSPVPDVLMCSSGVVVNYNTDAIARDFEDICSMIPIGN